MAAIQLGVGWVRRAHLNSSRIASPDERVVTQHNVQLDHRCWVTTRIAYRVVDSFCCPCASNPTYSPIDRLRFQPANRAAELRFRALLASAGTRADRGAASRYRVLFVPGWAYRSHPETSADFAMPRRVVTAAGFDTALVATSERGTVIGNAQLIADALRRAAPRPVIVVSASKAGPEVAYSLGRLLSVDASRHVRAWVNVGGVLQGTALVDDALEKRQTSVPFFVIERHTQKFCSPRS